MYQHKPVLVWNSESFPLMVYPYPGYGITIPYPSQPSPARARQRPADPRRGRPVFLLLPSHVWFSNKPPVFLACAHHTHTPLPTSGFARAHTSAAANIHAVGFFIQVACALFFLARVVFTLSSTKFRSHLVWHIFYRLMLSVVYLGAGSNQYLFEHYWLAQSFFLMDHLIQFYLQRM